MLNQKTTPVIKSVELPTGVTLDYVEQGDPAGGPMVLLHGVTDSWRSYERVLPHLPPSLHAFALSQRGHGDSSHPADGYRPQDFAADVAAFLDARQLGPAVIVGHSMGSIVAQRFALDYPERTRGLALAGSLLDFAGNPAIVEFAQVVAALAAPIEPGFAQEFQESTLARPVPPAYLETVVRESLKVPARVWRAVFAALMETDYSGEVSQITAPTLICWGDQDASCPRGDQDALAAAITGAQLLVYRGAGHALHWEEPERFAADLAACAQQIGGAAARPAAAPPSSQERRGDPPPGRSDSSTRTKAGSVAARRLIGGSPSGATAHAQLLPDRERKGPLAICPIPPPALHCTRQGVGSVAIC